MSSLFAEINDNAMIKELSKRVGVENIEDCLNFPKYFEIETINLCNAKCKMCTVEKWDNKNRENNKRIMSDEIFQKYLEEIKYHVHWIESVGLHRNGEPTLDKNLISKIKSLKNIGIKNVNIITNGSLVNEDLSIQLINSGLDEIMFSIDSNRKDVFESIRKGLDFDVVFNNILGFIELRDKYKKSIKIRVRMVMLEENQDEVYEWLEFWRGKTNKNIDKVYAMSNHFWGNHLSGNKNGEILSTPCVSPFSTMVILSDGKIAMCGPDFDEKNVIGDFNKSSIKEIWNSEKFNELRRKHLNKERYMIDLCKTCTFWDKKFIGK